MGSTRRTVIKPIIDGYVRLAEHELRSGSYGYGMAELEGCVASMLAGRPRNERSRPHVGADATSHPHFGLVIGRPLVALERVMEQSLDRIPPTALDTEA